MKKYIVGGAVRDHIMGVEAKDRDWVIVGATKRDIERLIESGYKQVGADFPVFLNPFTNEEYALARIERKTGDGYLGFECETENVSLEQDLLRRDLTMNAIAYDPVTKEVVDPYNGREDIKNRVIRHVSDAFAEDPVRVLRVARFAARYGFAVHDSTKALMEKMAKNGDLKHLQRERVMQEMVKCVTEGSNAFIFIRTLRNCGAWAEIFPSIPAPMNEHLEIIERATTNCATADAMYHYVASLLYRLTIEQVEKIQREVVFPKQYYQFAVSVIKSVNVLPTFSNMKPTQIVEFFDMLNVHNKGGETFLKQLNDFVFATGNMTRNLDDYILKMYDLYSSVDIMPVMEKYKEAGTPLVGRAVRDKLTELRIQKIGAAIE